jgi:hypothetical protein
MDLGDVRALPAGELSQVLDSLGIEPGWSYGDEIRSAPAGDRCLPEPAKNRSQAFQNLAVGTIAERVFREDHLTPLEPDGFTVVDYHERGENRDYGLQRGGLELPINVKTASTLFYSARRQVGLDPDDCVPISAYKAIGASERVPALVYVDLVDFTLRERVDDFVNNLAGDLAVGWHLLSWYLGPGARRAQDRYVQTLFDRYDVKLKALAPPSTSFRVISARRVLAIMRQNPRRVPGLGIKAAGTGVFNAEVNVHISVRDETQPWDDIAEQCRSYGIQHVLDQITRTAMVEIPEPLLLDLQESHTLPISSTVARGSGICERMLLALVRS